MYRKQTSTVTAVSWVPVSRMHSWRAAKKTIVTTERLVGTYRMQEEPKLTTVPHFLVEAVVVVPGGAKPGICYPEYQKVDDAGMKAYTKAVKAVPWMSTWPG